jgi:large conductance mechanosensitive channel
MSLIGEFKAFALKGNVLDLAVAVIIGGAFGKIVDSVVKDVIMPLVGAVGGQPDFSALKIGPVMIGNFMNAVVAFLMLAAVVFFVIVKPASKMMAKMEAPAPTPAGPPPATLDDVVAALKELKK